MSHGKLCENAKKAVDKVFGDISVPRRTTRKSLQDIVDHIEICMDCLNEDDEEQRLDN